jgi:hypothetical protein
MNDMDPSGSDPLPEVRRREEAQIQRDFAIVQVQAAILARFHDRAQDRPELWQDPAEAKQALGAAHELQAVENELHIFYVQQTRRLDLQVRAQAAAVGGGNYPAETVDSDRRFRGDALYAQDGFEAAIHRLRSIDPDDPFVRRADRDRRARLRWLLTLLNSVQPKAAKDIERAWEELRSRPADQPGPRVERWERQTGDWLVLFLEPLLPQ